MLGRVGLNPIPTAGTPMGPQSRSLWAGKRRVQLGTLCTPGTVGHPPAMGGILIDQERQGWSRASHA